MLTKKLPNGQYRIAVEKIEKPNVESRLKESDFFEFPDAYSSVEWGKRDVILKDSLGNILFNGKDLEFPVSWSGNACKIVSSKYFVRKENGDLKEKSLKQMIDRVCDTIGRFGYAQGYFFDNVAKDRFINNLKYMVVNQIFSFNSPVWFNVGVQEYPQCSACFITSVDDSMESILDQAKTQGLLFKYGSGNGTNVSTLRSSREQTSGGGKASGPLSFMRGWDAFAGVIRSGGVLRRSAAMTVLNVDHPDIFEFIDCKVKEEDKARALVAAGYDGGIGGEAYASVWYQNTNNSVRVTDKFMEAVDKDLDWGLIEVSTGKVNRTVKARKIMRAMAESAWKCGDPGIQYHDTINNAWPVKDGSVINASNPCSEVHLPDNSACNLASINLIKMFDDPHYTGSEGLDFIFPIVVAQDILIDNSSYPTEQIAINSSKYRPLGLGYTNLGAYLMRLRCAYSSIEAQNEARSITSDINAFAWQSSQRLGQVFSSDLKMDKLYLCDSTGNFLKYSPRNSQVTVLAPTGTISFMMDAITTGIEPELSLVKSKTMVGGGTIYTINPLVSEVLKKLNYSEKEIEQINEKLEKTGSIFGLVKAEHEDIFLCALPDPVTGKCLPYQAHIDMMAAVQPYISGAISKTVNLPNSATVEDIEKIYIDGWKKGLKCIAVYRDGCKVSQPMNTKKETKPKAARERLADTRDSITHKFDIDGKEGYLTVGKYSDGRPGELFISMSKQGSTLSGLLDSLGTSVSLGLQHGVPIATYVEKFKHTKFDPAGFTQNPQIRMTSSIVDYIGRFLEKTFIDKGPEPATEPSSKPKEASKGAKASGNTCKVCGAETYLLGSCEYCPNCNTSGGCS